MNLVAQYIPHPGPRFESPDGAKVQDVTRLAGAHGRQGGTRNNECSLDVYCECRANLISGDFFDGPNEAAARVIHQYIPCKAIRRQIGNFAVRSIRRHAEASWNNTNRIAGRKAGDILTNRFDHA
jgi:hypothetical protein